MTIRSNAVFSSEHESGNPEAASATGHGDRGHGNLGMAREALEHPRPGGVHDKRLNAGDCSLSGAREEGHMRKLVCFCDRCAIPAEWAMHPSRRNSRFFDLAITCHGETEYFLVAASELIHARDASSGRELTSPLTVIAFEDERPSKRVRVIETLPRNLSIRIPNHTNRLTRG
jgi:hypothetical protein